MALNGKIKVEMPARCVKVPKNGTTYIQYTLRAYRNEKGKPTSERIAIGKLDAESGMLIPNRNYYEIFEKRELPHPPEFVRSNGVYELFSGICKKTGVEKRIREVFPEQWKSILAVAQYMLTDGNIMYYFPDWQEETVSYAKEPISAQEISRLFSDIDADGRLIFFRSWMKERLNDEYLAYDVTSFSSYGKGIEDLEWGYNRDRERLPQINLAMYYGEQSGLPLYYRIYPGSIADKTHLRYMLEDNELLDAKKMKYMMDRGFYSSENLRLMAEKGSRFIIALPGSLKYVRELIQSHRNELINCSSCHLGLGTVYGKSYETNELGFRMKIHLYYDPQKALTETETLYEELNRIENELKRMEEPPDRKLHYDKYFFINRSKDGKLGFVRNHKAIDEALSRCGFFAIAETDFTKTTKEILTLYRRRDVVEKSFDDLKNALDMHRLHVHSGETADGKLFCAFIALIVRSYMLNHLREYMLHNKLTFDKLLLELKKSKQIISARYPSGCRPLNPLSATAKDIFRLCDVDFVC